MAGTLEIIGFLRGAISRIHSVTRIAHGTLGFLLLRFEFHQAIGQIADTVTALFKTRLRLRHFGAFFLDVGLDDRQLFANRGAT